MPTEVELPSNRVGGDRFYATPSSFIYPTLYGSVGDVIKFRPLLECFCNAINSYSLVASPIVRLVEPIRPIAVANRIPFVVIGSFKSVLRGWPVAHIVIKDLKGFAPTIADIYASAAVILKRLIVGVFTSISHCVPRIVNRSASHAMSLFCFACDFFGKASAGLSRPTGKTVSHDRFFVAAITNAIPRLIPIFTFFTNALNNKATKYFSFKADRFFHMNNPVYNLTQGLF